MSKGKPGYLPALLSAQSEHFFSSISAALWSDAEVRKNFPIRQKMICTCRDDHPCFQNRNHELAHFQSVEAVNRPAYLSGTRVALCVSTMDIQFVNSGEGAANKSVSKACASENGPDAGTGASDAIFSILMAQLMGSVVQSNQQTAPDASQAKATDSAVSGKNGSATLVAQGQIPLLPTAGQQTIDKSSPIPGGQKQADVPTASASFSEQLNVDEKNKQSIPTQPKSASAELTPIKSATTEPIPIKTATTELTPVKTEALAVPIKTEAPASSEKTGMEGFAPGRNDTPEKPGQSTTSIEPGLAKTDYNMILLQQDTDAKSELGTGEGGSQEKGQNDSTPAKTDFLALMQQGQSSVQHQPAFTATARNADAPSSPVPLQHQVADPADLIDHAVSIVKDGNRLAVKLEPDGLGKLDINLSLDKGTVSAQIHVSNDVTKNLLENNKQQMMNALMGEGLSVGGFSVSLNHKGTWDGSAEGGQGGGLKSTLPQQTAGDAGRADARGLVSIFV